MLEIGVALATPGIREFVGGIVELNRMRTP
jgi:hypothetical protein